MRSTMGSRFRIGDLAEIVLGLYGALPLPVEENPNKNMGRLQGSKTLVLADSPNKMTGLATLRQSLRDKVARSPLCNAKAYARSVEAAYRALSALMIELAQRDGRLGEGAARELRGLVGSG